MLLISKDKIDQALKEVAEQAYRKGYKAAEEDTLVAYHKGYEAAKATAIKALESQRENHQRAVLGYEEELEKLRRNVRRFRKQLKQR